MSSVFYARKKRRGPRRFVLAIQKTQSFLERLAKKLAF